MPKEIYNGKPIDQVKLLTPEIEQRMRFRMECVDPMDAKYGEKVYELVKNCLSHGAEFKGNAYVQYVLLETLFDFGKVSKEQVDEAKAALDKIDTLNIHLLEEKVTRHDQLAVLVELGRYVRPETVSIMHPGTTSYDIVDTTRPFLFKKGFKEYFGKPSRELVLNLANSSEAYMDQDPKLEQIVDKDIVQQGRTHLQYTAPVLFGSAYATTARRLAQAYKEIETAFDNLRGKISGIVGTGAGIEQFVGEGKDMDFEKCALAKLGLKPEICLSQTTSKETYLRCGQAINSYMKVLSKFANDTRMLYSSDIQEVVSRKIKVGGSSTDAFKDNPIDWENIVATDAVVESGLVILNAMMRTDFQRDLRDSKLGRFEPQRMISAFYETVNRTNESLKELSVNQDKLRAHLEHFRKIPSEAMVTILKSYGFMTDKFDNSHEFVKSLSTDVKLGKGTLLELANTNEEFSKIYNNNLSDKQKAILQGDYTKYLGSAKQRTRENIAEARKIILEAS